MDALPRLFSCGERTRAAFLVPGMHFCACPPARARYARLRVLRDVPEHA